MTEKVVPVKVEISRLPEIKEDNLYAFSSEKEAQIFAEQINQPRYYWFPANHTYYVPILPGQNQ